MADFIEASTGRVVTLMRDEGHQIRIVTREGDQRLRVTCRCQLEQPAPWAPFIGDTDEKMWRKYNGLPHDPAAGPFEPADEATGFPVTALKAAP